MEAKVAELSEAIKNNVGDDAISSLESTLAMFITETSKVPLFYKLPIQNISSILAKVQPERVSDYGTTLMALIPNVVKEHNDSSALLLQNLNCDSLAFKDCISVLQCFETCPLCKRIGVLYTQEGEIADVHHEIENKNKEIQSLKQALQENDYPLHLEADIHKAAAKGDLPSIKYLLKRKEELKERKDHMKNTPLLSACRKWTI